MKRMTLLIMSAATLCQAMDIVLCLDEIAQKKKAERWGCRIYLDDSDPTVRMEKIWHHGSPVRDEKQVGPVIKRAVTKKVVNEERSVGMSVPVFLKAFDSAFPSRYDSYASFLMDRETERIESERKKAIEEEEKRAAILKELQDRRERVIKIFGNIFESPRTVTALVLIQLAAAPILIPIIEPSDLITAPQESFNIEKVDVQKIASLPIKRVPTCRYDRFLPKNEKRSSRTKPYRIQQP